MSSRNSILASVRDSIGRARKSPLRDGEIGKPELPYVRPVNKHDPIEQMLGRMSAVQMTLEQLDNIDAVPEAVRRYLAAQNASIDEAALDISPQLRDLAWPRNHRIYFGKARWETHFAVTACIAAVAETGSVLMASGADHPVTLTFLPDCHIVVLRKSQIVAYLEDAWPLLRKLGDLPRAINLNTGPSRTGDIEQTIEVGAHGPRAMHVLLVK